MVVAVVTNKDTMALGFWDTDRVHHIAAPMGGTAVLVPDMESLAVIRLFDEIGAVSAQIGDDPVFTTDPSISGDATVGETLTLDVGEWVGGGTHTVAWYSDDVVIEGETGETLVLGVETEGTLISAIVTVENDDGTAMAETDSHGPVAAAE